MKIVLVGGADHGKSTLLARLADEARFNPEAVPFVDSLAEEKEGLYTLDSSQVLIEVNNRYVTLIDVPGQDQLIRNMVTGASQADASILVLDAAAGICEMTLRHLNVLRLLKISPHIVCVTKMETVDYASPTFETLATSISQALQCDRSDLAIIPVSAYTAENISSRAETMPWYHGPTLWQALSDLPVARPGNENHLRFMLQDHYRVNGRSIYVGRVAAGEISRGQELTLYPERQLCRVRSIEKFGEPPLERAAEGDCIGLTLEMDGIARIGQLLCPVNEAPLVESSLSVTLMNLETETMDVGAQFEFQCASLEALCHVSAIQSTNLVSEANAPDQLRFSEIGEATLSFDKPIAVEHFQNVPSLGRFVLARADKTVAGGVINGSAKDVRMIHA